MAKIAIKVTADFSQYLNVKRYAEKNKPIILNTAAERYLRYLKDRFLRLSRGEGEWPPLQSETIERKRRRSNPKRPEFILRERGVLYRGLGIRTAQNSIYVGYVQNMSHWSGRGTIFLAQVHTRGLGVVPIRRVTRSPAMYVRKNMVDDIRKEYQKIIRRNRYRDTGK